MGTLDDNKIRKALSQAFLDNADSLNEDQALDALFREQSKIAELKEELKEDEDLRAAQSVVKELKAGYDSAIKNAQNKSKFLIDKIKELRDENPNTDGVD